MNKKPFCVMPYVHSSTTNSGNYRVCCHSFLPIGDYNVKTHSISEVWNSTEYQQIRQDLESGIFPSYCNHCKNLEENGIFSPRLSNNQNHKTISFQNIPNLPYDIDLKVGSKCNLKCITCYPGASNQHQKEVDNWQKNNVKIPSAFKKWYAILDHYELDPKTFSSSFNPDAAFDSLKECFENKTYLSIVGGEPLINTQVIYFLEKCIDQQLQHNIHLSIITNLTEIDTKVFEFINQFETHLYISFDHIDPIKFNYIRYPANFDNFIQNFNKLQNYTNIVKQLSTTWSIFNISDIIEILEYWEKLRLINGPMRIQFNLVDEPSYFSIKYLEKDYKLKLADKIEKYINSTPLLILTETENAIPQINGLINALRTMPNDYTAVRLEQLRVLNLYDSTRNIDYKKIFGAL